MLKVNVVHVQNLVNGDGKSDVLVQIAAGIERYRTKPKKPKSGRVAWKQSFAVPLEENLRFSLLQQQGRSGDTLLGQSTLDLGGAMLDGTDTLVNLGDDASAPVLTVQISASATGPPKGKSAPAMSATTTTTPPNRSSSTPVLAQQASAPGGLGKAGASRALPSSGLSNSAPSSASNTPQFTKKQFETGDKMSSSASKEIKRRTKHFIHEQEKSSTPYKGNLELPCILDISGCEATYVPLIVGEIGPKLEGLSLGFNRIRTWPRLEVFPNLVYLHLDGNHLTAIPQTIAALCNLRELSLNGNRLTSLPPQFSCLTSLEILRLSNNKLESLCPEIGELCSLEELLLNGNPLQRGLPRTIGNCYSLEIVDLSCCSLDRLPDEFTRITKLMELNLATNKLTALPATMGRMTRLVKLDLSDNKLPNLPVSIGFIEAMQTMLLEGNPIQDREMLQKYQLGPDHLNLYLQKKLNVYMADHPEIEEQMRLPADARSARSDRMRAQSAGSSQAPPKQPSPRQHNPATSQSPASSQNPSPSVQQRAPGQVGADSSVQDKLQVLKRDSVQLTNDINMRLSILKRTVTLSSSLSEAVPCAHAVRNIKQIIDPVKPLIPPTAKPNPPLLREGEDQLSQVKKTVNVAILDLERIVNSMQNAILGTSDPHTVINLFKAAKATHHELAPYS